jgi:hypothetical protein
LSIFQIGQNIIHFYGDTVEVFLYGLYQSAFFFGSISVGETQVVNICGDDCYRSVCLVDLQICICPHRAEYIVIAFGEHERRSERHFIRIETFCLRFKDLYPAVFKNY